MDNIKYSQPDFYHFNEDSILLVKETISFFKPFLSFKNVLDLCAGCGVVGIELSLSIKSDSLDFIELQEDFVVHLKENILNYNISNTNIYNLDFLNCNVDKKYDLILMNPPYFDSEANRLGPNPNKNKCRLITKLKAQKLIKKIELSLLDQGHLCIVIPKNSIWSELLSDSKLVQLRRVIHGNVSILIFKNEQTL